MHKTKYWVLAGLSFLGFWLAACDQPAKTGRPQPVKLVFWEWWADQQPYYERCAREYETLTGVKVEFQLASALGADYANKLQAAAQANVLPDIIGIDDQRELVARYARAGKLADLTPALKDRGGEWEKSFFPQVMRRFGYAPGNVYGLPGGTYWGVPLTVMNIQIYYNKALFKKAGLDPERPPRTWDEFMFASARLQKAGIPPLLAGLGDLWVDYKIYLAYAWAYLGERALPEVVDGTLPFTDPRNLAALRRVGGLAAVLYPGCVSMPNKEAEINFANQKAAMAVNGSWAVNVYAGLNPDLDLGVFSLPVPADAAYPMKIMGGIGKGCLISAASPHRAEAVAFLKWFSSMPQQVRLAKEARELPANMQAAQGIDPLLKNFALGMNQLAPDLRVEERKEIQEALSKGVQSLLLGEVTAEQVLSDIQNQKHRALAKP
jgi:ABC-type glycerol-3-phosphate transport system substrate-binding protein